MTINKKINEETPVTTVGGAGESLNEPKLPIKNGIFRRFKAVIAPKNKNIK